MRFEIIISLSEFNPNLLNLDMLTAEKKKYTKEDYQALDEGAPFQLINSDLVMTPAPTSYHQILSARIFKLIDSFLEQSNNGGICLFALDVQLDEENIFQPDLLYIAEGRKAELVKDRIIGAPEKYGVKEFILVDPIQRNAEVHSLQEGQFVLKQKSGIN